MQFNSSALLFTVHFILYVYSSLQSFKGKRVDPLCSFRGKFTGMRSVSANNQAVQSALTFLQSRSFQHECTFFFFKICSFSVNKSYLVNHSAAGVRAIRFKCALG